MFFKLFWHGTMFLGITYVKPQLSFLEMIFTFLSKKKKKKKIAF
ncbi:unnamed protein product, partial [Arabidopsis halleri]